MTTKATWLDLATRCEKATGPEDYSAIADTTKDIMRALNYSLRMGMWWSPKHGGWWDEDANRIMVSIDAIAGLIDRELPGSFITCLGRANEWTAGIRLASGEEGLSELCATEPLARCAAFCKAIGERATE